jgi:hypothetical protein
MKDIPTLDIIHVCPINYSDPIENLMIKYLLPFFKDIQANKKQ